MAIFEVLGFCPLFEGLKNSTTEAGGSKTLGQSGVNGPKIGHFWPILGVKNSTTETGGNPPASVVLFFRPPKMAHF